MANSKKRDIILLVLFPIFASIISLIFKTNFLISILLFFGIPSVYLSFLKIKSIKKTLIFSLIFSIPMTIIIEYLAVTNKAWLIESSFKFRLFNLITIEAFIWAFLALYFIIIFYEYFIDKGKNRLIEKNLKYLIFICIGAVIIFLLIILINPLLIKIKYFYMWLGILFILLPFISFLSFFPKLASKFIKTAVYFFIVFFIHELTALKLNHWSFPTSEFIGWLSIIGNLTFPIEEFIFFIALGTLGMLSWYEFFADDKK